MEPIEPRAFRRVLGNFATGVTVVTACDAAGRAVGVTASSFNSVSLSPPLILWSLDRNAFSRAVFETSAHFIVNVLAVDQLALSERFATRGSDKFRDLDWVAGLGGAPRLNGCAAVFECRKQFVYEGGDHLILVGEVMVFTESGHAALLFYRGQYSVPEPHPELRLAAHKPTGFVEDHLDYLLNQAAARLQHGFAAVLHDAAMEHLEWRVLATLSDHLEGLSAGELSLIDLIASEELERVLAALTARDWVRATRAGDGTHRYQLTAAGHATLVPVQIKASAHEVDALSGFSPAEVRRLKDLLKRLLANPRPATSPPANVPAVSITAGAHGA